MVPLFNDIKLKQLLLILNVEQHGFADNCQISLCLQTDPIRKVKPVVNVSQVKARVGLVLVNSLTATLPSTNQTQRCCVLEIGR